MFPSPPHFDVDVAYGANRPIHHRRLDDARVIATRRDGRVGRIGPRWFFSLRDEIDVVRSGAVRVRNIRIRRKRCRKTRLVDFSVNPFGVTGGA